MSTLRLWHGCVFIATSLDGYIARRDGDIEWLTDPRQRGDHCPGQSGAGGPKDYEAFMASVDHLVMGRGTYEKILTFDGWPYGSKQVVVLSRTLPRDGDDRITITRSIDETLSLLDLRRALGVYIDGGQVVQEFLAHDLVDEVTITRAPVLLGDGLPLFGTLQADIRLIHAGTTSSDSGMTSSLYYVAH
ncbi:MAG: dihydrofolate reductase family protein [Actinomycetota bacterium]|nr:dihydrofolate reductase family protein [Actinomycetota bacterium]